MKSFFVVLSFLTITAYARTEIPGNLDPEIMRRCMDEVSDLGCGDPRTSSPGKVYACMEKNLSSLSEECQDFHRMLPKPPR